MAPLPVITHRVRVHADTSVDGMGKILVQLNLMGLENVGYEIIEETHAYKNKVKHDTTAAEALSAWTVEHPTFHIKEAVQHLVSLGRTKAATYAAAHVLVKNKHLKKLGEGNYSLASIAQIAGPKGAKDAKGKTAKAAKVRPRKNYEVPNRDLLWEAIKGRKTFTASEMRALFAKHKRPEQSVGGQIFNLVADKLIKRVAEGEYLVVKNNKAKPKPKTKAKTKPTPTAEAMNGRQAAPAPTTESSAHG